MITNGENKLFDNEEIFKWSYDILNALTYLRTKCTVHRDVKPQFVFFLKLLFFSLPSNILIKKNGRAALGDMGHAKLTQRNGAGGPSKSKSLFLSKNIIYGTECYLAPEVIKRTFFIEEETNDAYFAIDIWLV
jgi:serine/threonine protein kinase